MQKFKSNVRFDADVTIEQQTANTVPVLDASKKLISSAVTPTELGYLDGVTSSIQDQLDNKADSGDVDALVALSGVAAGEEDLGAFTGNIISDDETIKGALQELETAIEALPNPMEYKGTWDADTNTPTLADGVGDVGDLYRVTVAGTVDFGSGDIEFAVGDSVVYNGTVWEKWDMSDSVSSVNGQTGTVVLDTGDISESGNLYFTDERAQDAVGTILADTASIELVYTDATPEITANVIPGGVDHDALLNYVAAEHVDHSAVQIQTNSNSGLSGGGDITATRSLVVDITGTTAETVADNADEILIYDTSATARRKMTRGNFLAGVPVNSAGDINEASFSMANNQVAPANVTGLAFANATVRSFCAQVSIAIDATAELYEQYELSGIQKGSDWEMSQVATGDDSGVVFTITSAGQVQYTSANSAGFVSGTVKFRATTTTV